MPDFDVLEHDFFPFQKGNQDITGHEGATHLSNLHSPGPLSDAERDRYGQPKYGDPHDRDSRKRET